LRIIGGFNSPPTLFGIVIADVRDPQNLKPALFYSLQFGHALQLSARQTGRR